MLEIVLAFFALIGVFSSSIVNQRHASLVMINEILTGKASFQDLIQFMKGKYQSKILGWAFALFQISLLVVLSSITNVASFSKDGAGICLELSAPLQFGPFQASYDAIVSASIGSPYTCSGCEGITTPDGSLLVPLTKFLQSYDQKPGTVRMRAVQDIVSVQSFCTVTSSEAAEAGKVIVSFLPPTSTNGSSTSLSFSVTSKNPATQITTTRYCTILANDYSGDTLSLYKISPKSTEIRYDGLYSITSATSGCTKVGPYCLAGATIGSLSYQLLSRVFTTTSSPLKFSQDYSYIFDMFPDPASSLSDAMYNARISRWISFILRNGVGNYVTNPVSCTIFSNRSSVAIQLLPALSILLLVVTAFVSLIGFIILARDVYNVRSVPNALLRRLSINTFQTKEQLEDLADYAFYLRSLPASAKQKPLSFGEDPMTAANAVGKLKFGSQNAILPIEPGRTYR
ncbi:hypothetical protein HDU91_004653 [Kappamyces sp. JEL0680]|nr:hypothetical protein HDU91_004653 [Kappamyces sp. JEL0680]